MQISVAAVFTPDATIGFAATDTDALLSDIYDSFVAKQAANHTSFPDVTALAENNKPEAAKLWFRRINQESEEGYALVTETAELVDHPILKECPETILLGITRSAENVTLIPATTDRLLYPTLYQSYIKPRLTGRMPDKEALVESLAINQDYTNAVLTWFKMIGYSTGRHKLCTLQVHVAAS